MQRSILLAFVLLCGASGLVRGQLTWTEIPTPATVSQFALGSDGSLYVLTGGYQSGTLFYSGNDGAKWTQIYSGPSIEGLSCDSNGAVIILDGPLFVSTDHGASWDTSGSISAVDESLSFIASTAAATYFAYGAESTLQRTTDYGNTWESLGGFGSEIAYNWAGLYAGVGDRVIGTLADGGFALFANAQQANDTFARTYAIADNSPPQFVLFGRDGYIYAYELSTLLRLPANTLKWESYGDTIFNGSDGHIPFGSANAINILSFDSSSTYASSDHGDTWSIIGTGIPNPFPLGSTVAFGPDGKGYIAANRNLYQTSFFQSSVTPPPPQPPIALYPIPCTSSLTIHANAIERVEIVDLLGVTRIDREFQGASDPELDVSNLAPGVYSIIVVSGGQRELVRMVKE